MHAVSLKEISFSYPPSKRGAERKQIFENFSLQVEKQCTFGLLGPNGGGKTTLFRILSTYFKPTSGSAHVFDVDIASEPNQVRQKIGVVFQNPSLDKKLTLKENLVHQGHLYGLRGETLENRITRVLQKLGLSQRQDQIVDQLSGGLQRRGEIAKSLLHEPELLLMDEPSTGLDPGARRDLWDALAQLKKAGVTILITTHLMEEGDKCDQLAILHEGKLQAEGTPSQLKSRIGGDVIALQTDEPETLAQKIKEKFNEKTSILDGLVRIEKENGHQEIPKLIEAFPGLIQSATVGKPTLEDVFIHETGHHLWEQ